MELTIKTKKAFSTVEVILAASLFTLLVVALLAAFGYSIQQEKINSEESKAVFLMEEGLELISNISANSFISLTPGSHGFNNNSGQWALGGAFDVQENYKRSVTLIRVDEFTFDAEVRVTWESLIGNTKEIKATQRVTDYNRRIIAADTWKAVSVQSSLNVQGSAPGLRTVYSGNTAFIIKPSGTPNFAAINIANINSPGQTWTLTLAGNPQDIEIQGNNLFITTNSQTAEVIIVDINSRSIIKNIDIIGNENAINNSFVQNSFLYVVSKALENSENITEQKKSLLTIYNVSDARNAYQVSSLSFPESVALNDVTVAGNYAYLVNSANNGELAVVDISAPQAPQFKVALDLPGIADAQLVKILDSVAFIGRVGDSNIYVVNIGNPLAPVLISSFDIAGVPSTMSFGIPNNRFLYVSNSNVSKDLQVINLSDLKALSVVSTFNAPYPLNGLIYNPSLDKVIAVSTNNQGEFVIFKSGLK